jgi:DNA relaxase NicK
MDKNLMEKELTEYIQDLVLAKTDERRLAFMKEKHHSINKAVGRIKKTCSKQMFEILNHFNWLFNAFAE